MNERPGRERLSFLPDEARSLPPPRLNDPRLVYIGFMGYCAGLLDNALRMRPVLKAGEGCAGPARGGAARCGPPRGPSRAGPCCPPGAPAFPEPCTRSSEPSLAAVKKAECGAAGNSKPHTQSVRDPRGLLTVRAAKLTHPMPYTAVTLTIVIVVGL